MVKLLFWNIKDSGVIEPMFEKNGESDRDEPTLLLNGTKAKAEGISPKIIERKRVSSILNKKERILQLEIFSEVRNRNWKRDTGVLALRVQKHTK